MRRGLVLVALFAAVAGWTPPALAADIGVVLGAARQLFWRPMIEGIRDVGADLKVGVVIRSTVDGAAIEGHRPPPRVSVDVVTVTRASLADEKIRPSLAHYEN